MSKEVKDRELRSNRVLVYVILFIFSMFATGFISRALNDNGNRYEIRFSGKKQDINTDGLSHPDKDLADTLSYDNNNNKIYESQNNVPTVKKLLTEAMEPVGTTLYVYGGGWNEDDSGAGVEALSYGISPRWYEFFKENDENYDFQDTMYQIHDGLDCTGYVGYVVYQVFGDSLSDKGYVFPSKDMVGEYADKFNGTFINKDWIERYYPGDIMGTDGHVFIVIGKCVDGSLLFVHASPPVVSICGTKTPDGNSDSEAVRLAKKYMSKYFPESFGRYDTCIRDTDFLTDYNQMHWNRNVLSDPDGYDDMTPEEIMMDLFREM
ncbi:MAG: hypothetical protein IJ141_09400 [Lachnospiraceae bacterium]|nr:hypothetical protein [Lachnospiraceae bacterium]